MAEIGAGGGSGYPGALDTNSTLEVDNSTLARADVPNDLAAAIVAIETELGTDPAGTKTDVKTFLQIDHQTDGTHWRRSAKTDNYTVLTSDNMTLFEASTSGGNITFTLPTLSSATDNFLLAFKKTHSSNSMILDGNSSETIDGATTQTYTSDDDYVIIWSNGTDNWMIVSDPGGISNVVEDTTPQLGGNLDVNGNSVVTASNANLSITPNGSGDLILDGLKWPQADGTANYFLKTDGSAQLSWATAGGKILQIVQGTPKTDTASASSGTFVDITGMTVNITPSLSTSKVLVFATTNVSIPSGSGIYLQLVRGSTNILQGDSSGSGSTLMIRCTWGTENSNDAGTMINTKLTYVDSPATTSETTYKLQWRTRNSNTGYINRQHTESGSDGFGGSRGARTASTIIVVEIGA